MDSRAMTIAVGLAAGIALTAVAVWLGLISWRLRKQGKLTSGVITRIVNGGSGGEAQNFYPEFSFEDLKGRNYTVQSSQGANTPGFDVGQKVRVLYDPAEPSMARIDTFAQMWLFPVLFGVGGPLALVLTLVYWLG